MRLNLNTVESSALKSQIKNHHFDVRASAKTDEKLIREIIQCKKDGSKKFRLPYAYRLSRKEDVFAIADGRHEAASQCLIQFEEGIKDPTVNFNLFTHLIWDEMSEDEQESLKNWALTQNIAKDVRRPATFDDEYSRVKELMRKGWTAEDIRNAFKTHLPPTRITALLRRSESAIDQEFVAVVRSHIKVAPKTSAKETLRDLTMKAGYKLSETKLKTLSSRAEAKKYKKRGDVDNGIRIHKLNKATDSFVSTLSKKAGDAFDSYRAHAEGRAGITPARLQDILKKLGGYQRRVDTAIEEVISRGETLLGQK